MNPKTLSALTLSLSLAATTFALDPHAEAVTRIVTAATRLLADPAEYARRSLLRNPYGDGTAAVKIARLVEAELQN